VVAVGGLDEQTAPAAIAAGAAGVAVGSAILTAADPATATRRLHALVAQALAARA
jgi:thiamine monophosphate synthase